MKRLYNGPAAKNFGIGGHLYNGPVAKNFGTFCLLRSIDVI